MPGTDDRDRIRQVIGAVMRSAIGIDLGEDEDFFMAGGSSTQAVRFVLELERDHGLTVSVADFLSHSTIAGLSDLVAEQERTGIERSRTD